MCDAVRIWYIQPRFGFESGVAHRVWLLVFWPRFNWTTCFAETLSGKRFPDSPPPPDLVPFRPVDVKPPTPRFGIPTRFSVLSPISLCPRFGTASPDCLLSPGSLFCFPRFDNVPDSKPPQIRRQLVSLRSVYLEPSWPISCTCTDNLGRIHVFV